MKILIINKFLYQNGGSETYIFKIGKKLQEMGNEVQYFGMEHEKRVVGNHAESYTGNIDFHTGKLKKIFYPFKIIYSLEARKKIAAVLVDFQPDIIHLNNFNFQLTPSILYEIRSFEKRTKKKIRIVYTAHDSQLVCPNHLMQNPITKERCKKCLEGSIMSCVKGRCIHGSAIKSILGAFEHEFYKRLKTYRMIDKIICPSNFLKECLKTDKILSDRLVVLHNFVDVELEDRRMNKENYVLYFGRYSQEKGIETLLNIILDLPEIPFVFVGNGPLKNKIEMYTNIEDKGFLHGKELYRVIQHARLSIFPSECYENCPFSVMESIICKTPVLGAEVGGVPELIESGYTGELFSCGDKEQLKDKIQKLWENKELLKKYANNCDNVKFSSLEEYCEKLCEIYKEE